MNTIGLILQAFVTVASVYEGAVTTIVAGLISVLRPIRQCIGKNYFGKGKVLKDFSDNVDQLGYTYLHERLVCKFKAECDSNTPGKITADKMCQSFKSRIQDFETNKNGNEIWKRLYK